MDLIYRVWRRSGLHWLDCEVILNWSLHLLRCRDRKRSRPGGNGLLQLANQSLGKGQRNERRKKKMREATVEMYSPMLMYSFTHFPSSLTSLSSQTPSTGSWDLTRTQPEQLLVHTGHFSLVPQRLDRTTFHQVSDLLVRVLCCSNKVSEWKGYTPRVMSNYPLWPSVYMTIWNMRNFTYLIMRERESERRIENGERYVRVWVHEYSISVWECRVC